MSFLVPKTQSLGGMDGSNLASVEEGTPLPWFCGWAVLKALWVSNAYNRMARDEGRNSGEHWYCDIIAAFGYGPADEILGVRIQGRFGGYGYHGLKQWKTRAAYPTYYEGGVSTLGTNTLGPKNSSDPSAKVRVHWGLDDQAANDRLFRSGNPEFAGWPAAEDHPPYRRIITIEWKQLFIGLNSPSSIPNVEGIFGRKPKVPAWFGTEGVDYPTITLDSTGVNPILALVDLLTDETVGYAKPEEWFDLASWQQAATDFSAGKYALNPVIREQMTEDAVIEEFLRYLDCFLYDKGGKKAIGRIPDAVADPLDPADYPNFTYDDLMEVSLTTPGPEETINEVAATFIDRTEDHFKESTITVYAPHNRIARGEPKQETVDLSWSFQKETTREYASRFLMYAASPRTKGSISLRKNRAVDDLGNPVVAGDIIFISHNVTGYAQAFRVLSREIINATHVRMEIQAERGQYPEAVIEDLDTTPDSTIPDVPDTVNETVKLLTYPLKNTEELAVFPLVERPDWSVHRMTVHFSSDNVTYDELGTFTAEHFAQKGDIVSGPTLISGSNYSLTITSDNLEAYLVSQTEGQKANDELLLFAGDEIFSIGTITPTANPDEYTLEVFRARLDSVEDSHSATDDVWIIPRANVLPVGHQDLAWGSTVYFKFQLSNAFQSKDLGDVTPVSLTVPAQSTWLPAISITAPADANTDDIADGTYYMDDTVNFDFSITGGFGSLRKVWVVLDVVGSSQGNTKRQHIAKEWTEPAGTTFNASILVDWAEYGAVTVYAQTRYGIISKTLWIYSSALPAPTNLAVTVNSTDYYKFRASWDALPSGEYLVLEWTVTSQGWTRKRPPIWVNPGQTYIDVDTDAAGGISVRARRVRIANGRPIHGNVSSDATGTVNNLPAPTSFSLNSGAGPSWTIPAGYSPDFFEVWDDDRNDDWINMVRFYDPEKTSAALSALKGDAAAGPGDTITARVRYYNEGKWSAFSNTDSYTY